MYAGPWSSAETIALFPLDSSWVYNGWRKQGKGESQVAERSEFSVPFLVSDAYELHVDLLLFGFVEFLLQMSFVAT